MDLGDLAVSVVLVKTTITLLNILLYSILFILYFILLEQGILIGK